MSYTSYIPPSLLKPVEISGADWIKVGSLKKKCEGRRHRDDLCLAVIKLRDKNGLASSTVTGRHWREALEASPPGLSQCEGSARLLCGLTRAHIRNVTSQYDLGGTKCHTWGMLGTWCSGGEVTMGHVRCLLSWSCRTEWLMRQCCALWKNMKESGTILCSLYLWELIPPLCGNPFTVRLNSMTPVSSQTQWVVFLPLASLFTMITEESVSWSAECECD